MEEELLNKCGFFDVELTKEQIGVDSDIHIKPLGFIFYQRYKLKIWTREFQTIDKYNLQREENEGYSKLVV